MRTDLQAPVEHWRGSDNYLLLRQPIREGKFDNAFALHDFILDCGGSEKEVELLMKMRPLARVPNAAAVVQKALADSPLGAVCNAIQRASPLNAALFAHLDGTPKPGGLVPPERNEDGLEWLIRVGGVPCLPFLCDWAAIVGVNQDTKVLIRPSFKRRYSWETFYREQKLAVLIPRCDWPAVKKIIFERRAIDAVNEFTRARIREDGFYRRIMPAINITDNELANQVSAALPAKFLDLSHIHRPADQAGFEARTP